MIDAAVMQWEDIVKWAAGVGMASAVAYAILRAIDYSREFDRDDEDSGADDYRDRW